VPRFEAQVAELRDYLMKFARLQLRNETWAEDAVSEVMVAALSKPQSFGNRSQLKTWLVGILKHKIIDALRLHGREVCQLDDSADSLEDPLELWKRPQSGEILSNRVAAASFLKFWKSVPAGYRPCRGACSSCGNGWNSAARKSVRNWP
jgi:DNA-directed RNA polymerase specialized sigma24 family protein